MKKTKILHGMGFQRANWLQSEKEEAFASESLSQFVLLKAQVLDLQNKEAQVVFIHRKSQNDFKGCTSSSFGFPDAGYLKQTRLTNESFKGECRSAGLCKNSLINTTISLFSSMCSSSFN